jgi:bile acid:Na+ symporter, BASS family
MTLSIAGIRGDTLPSGRQIWLPVLAGFILNYVMLGGVLLGLSFLLIREQALRDGFILMVAVPPAIAIIPFSDFLEANTGFSLLATIACYLGALILTPLIALAFLGPDFVEPGSLVRVIVVLIVAPLVLARLLVWTSLARRLEPVKGVITNWSFFVVMYTIVGLNRELFLGQPLILGPVVVIALLSTFLLGALIDKAGGWLNIDPPTITSLVLLGTLKNYGVAGGLALALFNNRTAMPAAVSSVFMIVYIIWLDFRKRRRPPA